MTEPAVTQTFERVTSLWRDALLRLRKNRLAMAGLVILAVTRTLLIVLGLSAEISQKVALVAFIVGIVLMIAPRQRADPN